MAQVKIYYGCAALDCIAEETYPLEKFIKNRASIIKKLKSYDNDYPLDIHLEDSEGYYICNLDEEGRVQ